MAKRIKAAGVGARKPGTGREETECAKRNTVLASDAINADPKTSLRDIAKQTEFDQTTVFKILEAQLGKKSLRTARPQKLAKGNPGKRVVA